jgi:DNA polymerase-3 subunit delta'
MNPTAANTLLKTLEEPPPWTILVLLTTNEAAILPTLLSRCQRIRFLPLQPREVIDALVEEHGVSRSRARLAAGIAGGNLSQALELAEQVEAFQEEALKIASLPARGMGRSQLLSWAGQLAKAPDLPIILRLAVGQLRDLASVTSGGDALASTVEPELEAAARRVPLAAWLDGYLRVEQAIYNLETRYTNKRITLEQTLLFLNQLDKGDYRRGGGA